MKMVVGNRFSIRVVPIVIVIAILYHSNTIVISHLIFIVIVIPIVIVITMIIIYIYIIIIQYIYIYDDNDNQVIYPTIIKRGWPAGKISYKWAGIFQHAMFDYPREGTTIIMKIPANKNSNNDDSNND